MCRISWHDSCVARVCPTDLASSLGGAALMDLFDPREGESDADWKARSEYQARALLYEPVARIASWVCPACLRCMGHALSLESPDGPEDGARAH